MRAYCLNNISKKALNILESNEIVKDINECDSILVRSAAMHDMELPYNVLAVARAGAGVNNIPLINYAEKGIVVFNTPGANANAVKELVLCGLFLGSRDILGGIKYVENNKYVETIGKDIEKAKSKYAGTEIINKKISIIGLGVIGVLVANACCDLGMDVVGYDPYLSIENAMKLSKNVKYVKDLKDAVKGADFISIHVPLNDSTKGLINKDIIEKAKNGVILLNFARDLIVDENMLREYLESGKVGKYITDFPNYNVLSMENVIALPHLGASTEEAEDNCAIMAIKELQNYLENGNIINSVNYPNCDAGLKQSNTRITINHKNVPGMINKITNVITNDGANIVNMVNKSKNEYAYTILDIDCNDENYIKKDIEKIEDVLKVRIL